MCLQGCQLAQPRSWPTLSSVLLSHKRSSGPFVTRSAVLPPAALAAPAKTGGRRNSHNETVEWCAQPGKAAPNDRPIRFIEDNGAGSHPYSSGRTPIIRTKLVPSAGDGVVRPAEKPSYRPRPSLPSSSSRKTGFLSGTPQLESSVYAWRCALGISRGLLTGPDGDF